MLADERHSLIITEVDQRGTVSTAELIERSLRNGASLAFSAVTTCAAIAAQASKHQNLTVITNSTRIADEFKNPETVELFVTGGTRTRPKR